MATKTDKPSPKTVLVLGASYAGISAAHYTLKHILPSLPNNGSTYTVTLVSPNSTFFARPASPRALVSDSLLPTAKCFMDFQTSFAKYGPDKFRFVQGVATNLDYVARSVTVAKTDGSEERLEYYALVIATGGRTASPLLGLHKDETLVKEAWARFQAALGEAKSIVIAGGGPAGIETAGELGQHLNGRAGWFQRKLENPKVAVTVVNADAKILPILRPAIALQAEKYLAKVGVSVIKNVKVEGVTPEGTGSGDATSAGLEQVVQRATVKLSNGDTIDCDLYIPATGVVPNTGFLPADLLTEKGHVDTNPKTLRVDKAGPRVYAVGDVGSYTRGGILDLYDAVPVAMVNMKRDLLYFATAGEDVDVEKIPIKGEDKLYKPNLTESQVVPIGTSKGVGAFFGWRLPSIMVWLIKGRDYMLSLQGPIVDGSKWDKETKWKFEV